MFYLSAEEEQTHQITRVLSRLMGTEAYDRWAAHVWVTTTTWAERHELAAAKLAELVIDPDECSCVTPEQSCPVCRDAASAELEPEEIPY